MKNISVFILCLSLLACNTQPQNTNVLTNKTLNDSLFALKNIANTIFPSDTTIKYTKLDSAQKIKYLFYAAKNDGLPIDEEYCVHFMTARFIAKQNPIHNFTPIIIDANGDDFYGIFYLVTDSEGNPLSSLLVSGGINAGPEEYSDSLVKIRNLGDSFFKNDSIISYQTTMTFCPVIETQPAIFDSIVYTSTINPKGKIQTHRSDSVRYTRSIKLP